MIDTKQLFALIESKEVRFIDLRFTDLRGTWQHMTMSAGEFDAGAVKRGLGFDGSSIKGYKEIYESDMLLIPDMDTIFLDPFFEKTAVILCEAYDPIKDEYFEKDPRYTARKAEQYLKKTGVGDVSYWGVETEFFLFDKLNVDLSPTFSAIAIDSREVPGTHSDGDLGDGYKILNKTGYFPVPPFDKLQAFRSEMIEILEALGIVTECHHHEVATGGQVELDMKYDSLVKTADKVMLYKYVARNLAARYGMVACFLPKPMFGDNGSGMHTNQSIFKGGKNVFFDAKGYGELSDVGLSYAAGLLSNVKAVLGITNPTLNSYRRLVPHFEAPTSIAFSKRNRSAAIRIPMYYRGMEKAKRLEFRCPDPTTNPYLSFSAQLVSGVAGVLGKMDPVKMKFGPFDENIWEKNKVEQTPGDLFATLGALEKDKVLVNSGVFSPALIDSYISVKRDEALCALMYPTPADFHFYGDM
ncbi:type I glutamate--ammonia ligase [Candidatus Roizmanbacteria bacterium]|nr:type I glutamate--ammonia ligase [Candidatus Roizmanbacteria bacterium]